MNNETLLRTEEVAQMLNLESQTLAVWRLRGAGPQFVKLGRAVRYRPADIEAFVEAGRRTSTSEEPARA